MKRSLLALLLLAACGGSADPLEAQSPWAKFRGDLRQTGRSAHALAAGGQKWVYKTGKGIFSSPIVAADGTIYIGSADRSYYALRPDGTLRWKIDTGEIIDSSGLLDDRGNVYFGSGDGKLRAANAQTGEIAWETPADDPSTNKAYINWFEGNVGITPEGRLIVPNDNFFLYGVSRDTGNFDWKRVMPDQTWALPAVDPDKHSLFVANNNAVDFLGANAFAASYDDGTSIHWQANTAGTNAASPMLPTKAPDLVVYGSFDGYVHALSRTDGSERWSFATRDHVYSSPAELSDGTIVIPSTDGTVYALEPTTGSVVWTFDALEPIRSSPAVDGEDHIYFGGGDGKLYVLNGDGSLRWSMQLIDDVRNDLNASPALGRDAVYLAGESGEVFSVPTDYCLGAGLSDAHCSTAMPALPADGAELLSSTAFGAYATSAPDEIDANQALGFTLVDRGAGKMIVSILDATSIHVSVDPPVDVTTQLSGDGRFLLVTPKIGWQAGGDGRVSITISGGLLGDPDRTGLKVAGGRPIGTLSQTLTPKVRDAGASTLVAPTSAGDPQSVMLIDRLALPLPTMMPSYNQIGFDSLGYVAGVVSLNGDDGIAVMLGGIVDGQGGVRVDPATRAVIPLELHRVGGSYTLQNSDGLRVEVMNAVIPFHDFRVTAAPSTGTLGMARLDGSATCAEIPTYGLFLDRLGLCNAQTGRLTVFGAANLRMGDSLTLPAVDATVAHTGSKVVVALDGNRPMAANGGQGRFVGLLLVDDATGAPVPLDYGLGTTTDVMSDGTVSGVSLELGTHTLPSKVRVILLVDTYPAWTGVLATP